MKNIISLPPTQYKYPWGNISQEIVILFSASLRYLYQYRSSISETLFSPIHIKTQYQLIYALSITVCFVTKGFKVVLTGKIVFTLLSCHPLILFTISWIANTKKNNKVLNIYYPRYTCCSPFMKNVFLYHCITWYINYCF